MKILIDTCTVLKPQENRSLENCSLKRTVSRNFFMPHLIRVPGFAESLLGKLQKLLRATTLA